MIIKLNNKICANKDEAIALIEELEDFTLSITLDNGDEYIVNYVCNYGGRESWYKNGLLHREDGPAYESNSSKAWFKNGKFHREYGPAVEFSNGEKFWYFNGLKV